MKLPLSALVQWSYSIYVKIYSVLYTYVVVVVWEGSDAAKAYYTHILPML